MSAFKPKAIWRALIGAGLALASPSIASGADGSITETYGGRRLILHVPAHLPPPGKRALVIVLHGGLGNAQRIADGRSESALNMDAMAEKYGFVVAYLYGTPVTRMGGNMLGWNAGGGCCGQSAANAIDDVGYITGAVRSLEQRYGVDPRRVFGMGHSNGAMMTQRLLCETDLYAAGVAISGPLNLPVETCPAARGKRILAIHGQDDVNVPIAGGRGTKGLSRVAYGSEAHSRQVLVASGATYDLHIVAGAGHKLDDIDAGLKRSDGQSIQQEAVRFFGLAGSDR